jgi:hypothetical protein
VEDLNVEFNSQVVGLKHLDEGTDQERIELEIWRGSEPKAHQAWTNEL